jgi:hypothetical protein
MASCRACAAAGDANDRLLAFRQGLSEIGYAEGRNVGIDYRWVDGRYATIHRDVRRRHISVKPSRAWLEGWLQYSD